MSTALWILTALAVWMFLSLLVVLFIRGASIVSNNQEDFDE